MPKFKTAEAGERKPKYERMSPEFEKKLDAVMKSKDLDKLTEFFLANREYLDRVTPPKNRSTVTEQEFEEILAALKARDWDLFYDLTCDLTLNAYNELIDRLQATGEWLKAELDEGRRQFQQNMEIIQNYPQHIQDAIEVYLVEGDLSVAASLADMTLEEFYRFVKDLHLNYD